MMILALLHTVPIRGRPSVKKIKVRKNSFVVYFRAATLFLVHLRPFMTPHRKRPFSDAINSYGLIGLTSVQERAGHRQYLCVKRRIDSTAFT